MKKAEYDFLTWTSFPSSLRFYNDEREGWAWREWILITLPKRGGTLRLEVNVKQENVLYTRSHIPFSLFDGEKWLPVGTIPTLDFPTGTFNWQTFKYEHALPPATAAIRILPSGGAGSPEAPGITWFDDLRIYQDGKLIYENKFSNWLPYQIAGAIALSIPTALYAIPRLKRR